MTPVSGTWEGERLGAGPAGVDAYLWIKDPGASDGQCNGGPAAGQYWPQYALGLFRAHHGAGLTVTAAR